VGYVADRWGWQAVFMTMVACCLLTILCSALTLRDRPASRVARGV
jgi:OPA family glycerol-3-phosphate transporter-like MFS transporter